MNQERTKPQIQMKRHPLARTLSLLAACLVLVVVVGSLLLVLNAAQQKKNTSSQTASTSATPTKAPTQTEPVGKIVWQSDSYIMNFGTQWSPDGKRIASVITTLNGTARITTLTSWDAKNGAHKITYQTPVEELLSYIAWSPDSKLVAVAGRTTIYIFNAQSTHLVRTLTVPDTTASITPGFMTSTDGTQQKGLLHSMISLSGGNLIDNMIWSPDGKYIAASYHSFAPSSIFIWNASDGKPAKTLDGFLSSITDIAWSPDGSSLATLAYPENKDGVAPTAKIWNVSDWSVVTEYPNIYAMSWSPDSKHLALVDAATVGGKDVRIVDAHSGKTVKQLVKENTITNVSWSPDGSRIAVELGKIQIIDATTGDLLYTFSQHAYDSVWSPDGEYIACSQSVEHIDPKTKKYYYDGSILIWRAK